MKPPAMPQQPAAAPAPPPPVLGNAPQGSKPKKKPTTPSFLGNDATPTGDAGGKTLLGQ